MVELNEFKGKLDALKISSEDEQIYLFMARTFLSEMIPTRFYVRDDLNKIIYTVD
jgi:hypothetical protein